MPPHTRHAAAAGLPLLALIQSCAAFLLPWTGNDCDADTRLSLPTQVQCQQFAHSRGTTVIEMVIAGENEGCKVVKNCTKLSPDCTLLEDLDIIYVHNLATPVRGAPCPAHLPCLCVATTSPVPPPPPLPEVEVVTKGSTDVCNEQVDVNVCQQYATAKGYIFHSLFTGYATMGCLEDVAQKKVIWSVDGSVGNCGAPEKNLNCVCAVPTPAPPTPAPPTLAPTPAPPTPAPPTPAPATPSPPTPAPATTSPPTPAPDTPSPPTPAPPTPAPLTSAPATPSPPTPAPLTRSPPTPSPPTPAPLTASPPTPSPPTPAPPTVSPLTPSPPTPAPPTSAPPTRVPDEPPQTPVTSGAAIPGPAGKVLAGLSAASAASSGRLSLLTGAGDCGAQQGPPEYLPWTLHPTRITLLGSMWIGALAGNLSICAGCAVLASTILMASRCLVPALAPGLEQTLDTQGMLRLPSSIVMVYRILYQGTVLASLRLILSASQWYYIPLGLAGALVCTVVPATVFFSVQNGVPMFGRYRVDDMPRSRLSLALLGRGEWVSTRRERHFVQRYGNLIRAYRQERVWWCIADFASMFLLACTASVHPTETAPCCGLRVAASSILLLLMAAMVVADPFHRPRDKILQPLLVLTQALGASFLSIGYCSGMSYEGNSDEWMFMSSTAALTAAQGLLVAKVALDAACEIHVILSSRRERLQELEFGPQEEYQRRRGKAPEGSSGEGSGNDCELSEMPPSVGGKGTTPLVELLPADEGVADPASVAAAAAWALPGGAQGAAGGRASEPNPAGGGSFGASLPLLLDSCCSASGGSPSGGGGARCALDGSEVSVCSSANRKGVYATPAGHALEGAAGGNRKRPANGMESRIIMTVVPWADTKQQQQQGQPQGQQMEPVDPLLEHFSL